MTSLYSFFQIRALRIVEILPRTQKRFKNTE